jgi:phospholipid/cholesterol/gamma-HCH transport system ATP-binding protein
LAFPSVAAENENLIEITDVSFAYDRRPVLTGINMVIPRGKVVAIMGISGSGKTTLLRLISGVVKATRGRVTVAGKLVQELDQNEIYEMRRRMGMLFQFGALFTDLSVFDNVAFQMREHTDLPESMIRDLVLMKLHAVGLRGAHRLMPAELSGGMARRVALARAIALDPMLIMYDYMSDGLIVAQGTPEEMRAATEPLVRQFVYGEPDGPVPFQYPGRDFAQDLKLVH